MSHNAEELQSPKDYRDPAPKLTPEQLKLPTSKLYAAKLPEDANPNDIQHFTGEYAHLRARLDYQYHKVPTKSRQILQDSIVQDVLQQRFEECKSCVEDHSHPQVLFTAGAMASGKGHTLRHFLKNGQVSLPKDFIWVDPDSIARHFPERQQYMDFDATSTPEKLHPEASMLQEILSLIARERRQSLVVDGSLSDGAWFKEIMKRYRDENYSIEIFFVFAEIDVMTRRAKQREKETGRQTDVEHIKRSAKAAPESVRALAAAEHVHRVRLIDNSEDDGPPQIVYDSQGDPCFEKDGQQVNVAKYVNMEHKKHKNQKL